MQKVTETRKNELLSILKQRFLKNAHRHPNKPWEVVEKALLENSSALSSIDQMELSGGEPDVVVFEPSSSDIVYVDCSKESPAGRRSICYDQAALDARKEFKPADSALNMAKNMGIEVLNETQYAFLQTLEDFDTKTSSWLLTPKAIRDLDGSLFGDKRYKHTFFYHNGVQSYYKDRGFRGCIVL